MKRKETITPVGQEKDIDTDYDCGDSPIKIDELIDFLIDAKHAEATHVKLVGYAFDSDVNSVYVEPVKVELESDSDYNKRVKADEDKKISAEKDFIEKEKALYESLKVKYES